MNYKFTRFIGILLLSIGCIGTVWKNWPKELMSSTRYTIDRLDPVVERKVPVSLSFVRIGDDFEVVPGVISGTTWSVSTTKVNYLVGSGVIGDPGNVVLYAHRRAGLFNGLRDLQVGDEIQVWSEDVLGVYRVQDAWRVMPNDTDILADTGGGVLTLFTCDGPEDKWRWVVRASLVGRYPEAADEVKEQIILPEV